MSEQGNTIAEQLIQLRRTLHLEATDTNGLDPEVCQARADMVNVAAAELTRLQRRVQELEGENQRLGGQNLSYYTLLERCEIYLRHYDPKYKGQLVNRNPRLGDLRAAIISIVPELDPQPRTTEQEPQQ